MERSREASRRRRGLSINNSKIYYFTMQQTLIRSPKASARRRVLNFKNSKIFIYQVLNSSSPSLSSPSGEDGEEARRRGLSNRLF
jgi:hypothetical protein